jgi:hypothetical protein
VPSQGLSEQRYGNKSRQYSARGKQEAGYESGWRDSAYRELYSCARSSLSRNAAMVHSQGRERLVNIHGRRSPDGAIVTFAPLGLQFRLRTVSRGSRPWLFTSGPLGLKADALASEAGKAEMSAEGILGTEYSVHSSRTRKT